MNRSPLRTWCPGSVRSAFAPIGSKARDRVAGCEPLSSTSSDERQKFGNVSAGCHNHAQHLEVHAPNSSRSFFSLFSASGSCLGALGDRGLYMCLWRARLALDSAPSTRRGGSFWHDDIRLMVRLGTNETCSRGDLETRAFLQETTLQQVGRTCVS